MNKSNYLILDEDSTKVRSNSLTGDQSSANELNSIRDKLSKVENEVRRKRRNFRNWYRDHKAFALEFCPELFQILPDFRTPGSILGDGGFADMAKVQSHSRILPIIISSLRIMIIIVF